MPKIQRALPCNERSRPAAQNQHFNIVSQLQHFVALTKAFIFEKSNRKPRVRGRGLRVAFAFALGLTLAFTAGPIEAGTVRYQSGGWLLTIDRDAFTHQVACGLGSANGRLRYQPGAIGFLTGRHRDTLDAWYRIDGKDAVHWSDREPILIAAGAAIDGPGLDDPTGGWVWIPEGEVAQARTVDIRADSKARVHRYVLRGFGSMLEAAIRLGCRSYALDRA